MTFNEITAQMMTAVEGIRKAIYGVEVREHIAVAMENVLAVAQQVMDSVSTVQASEDSAARSALMAKQFSDSASTSCQVALRKAEEAKECAASAELSAGSVEGVVNAAITYADSAKASADRAAAIVSTDKTLSQDGAPADAKAVGEALSGKLGSKDSAASVNGFTFKAQTDDPGTGAELATGKLLIVYE